ncbi:hypothetical protein Ancab_028970 [Ancistrocladus abbreviatus]
MADVEYVFKRTVVSTKPIQLGRLYSLSVLDHLMEKHHLRVIHYFKLPVNMTTGNLTRKLRESFSEMLLCYPIVNGRLVRDDGGKWMIKCNDAGVRIVEAKARGSVESWLQNVDREKELQLVHWEDMLPKPYFWATFYLQLTEFEEGGLAVGLSCSHLLADPICLSMLIRAWADIALTGRLMSPPFFHPLPQRTPTNNSPNHKPNTHLIKAYKSITENSNPEVGQKLATVTLSFTDRMVQACMKMAQVNDTQANGLDPSPFHALAGLFWASISRLKGERNRLIDMSICVDMRKVMGLDKGFFGNCMVCNKVVGNGLDVDNISQAAMAVGEAMKKLDYEGIMDLIEWLESSNDCSPPLLMDGDDLICINLESLDSYSAIFDKCLETLRVSYYNEPVSKQGKVLVLPSLPNSGGPLSRVVMVTLLQDEAVKLCEDVLISHFSPTILMESA